VYRHEAAFGQLTLSTYFHIVLLPLLLPLPPPLPLPQMQQRRHH